MTEPRWLDETQQQAWRALLVVLNRGFPELERRLKDHEVSVTHYSILVELSEAPDATLRLSDLADAANVSQSRLTHRMRSLVDRRLVRIAPDSVDGRGKNAILSQQGRDLIEAVAPVHVEDVQRMFFDRLTPSDTDHLAVALSKVASGLCGHEAFQTATESHRSDRHPLR